MLRAIALNLSNQIREQRAAARWAALWLIGCALICGSSAFAQSQEQIKAAFLFNFARYVEWPETAFDGPEAPVRICMVRARVFADLVSRSVSGKSVGIRSVAVEDRSNPERSGGCHILYIGDDLGPPGSDAGSGLGGGHVFTVGDREGFAAQGGIANFIRVGNKIRFEINPNAAKRAGLKISSRLLRLAKVVQ